MTDYSHSNLRPVVASALILGDGLHSLPPTATTSPPSLDSDGEETTEEFKSRLTYVLGQMMFVSGETAEPGPETTWMIEEIVREQVVEMARVSSPASHPYRLLIYVIQLTRATILANRRGSKSISIGDLIFQIRHDRAKVSRLKTFLSWKDVRKNVKDSDDKGGGDAGDVGDFEEVNLPFLLPNPFPLPSPTLSLTSSPTGIRRRQSLRPSKIQHGQEGQADPPVGNPLLLHRTSSRARRRRRRRGGGAERSHPRTTRLCRRTHPQHDPRGVRLLERLPTSFLHIP